MILDGHIHIYPGKVDREDFFKRLDSAGVDGGIVISVMPGGFRHSVDMISAGERLENLFSWTEGHPHLYPFFFIDPMEEDALDQVRMANQWGVSGFKIICYNFYPGESKAMEVYRAISMTGKPILFHSGILWNGYPSAVYNRPAEFESLLDIEGLRFSLAHVSWPWYDENIAVYGKFLNAHILRTDLNVEMFIDTTPGTPPIYREEVLTKLLTVGYDVSDNVIFGTDNNANDYEVEYAQAWIKRDIGIYNKLGIDKDTIQKLFSKNLLRFIQHR